MNGKPRILVLGGGFAGLETAFMSRMRLGDDAEITLVSDKPSFLFKPNTIYIPFGGAPQKLEIPLAKPMAKRDITFVQARVAEVDPDANKVFLEEGGALPYDFLVIGTGATMRPDEIPGLGQNATTIFTVDEMLELRERLESLRARALAGADQEVLFLVPPKNMCSGPLYEIVFMLETWLRREKVRDRVHITYSTYEKSFIQAFGPRLHDVVTKEFARRGIDGFTGEIVREVREGEVRYVDGSTRTYDELISFPPYAAAVPYPGLPSDDRGFLMTELDTRQVVGHPNVYAPGDAGDFPVKQAFLAFLQSDSAADHIVSRIRRTPFRNAFDPVSMCVMEQFDKATFAQVPLDLTGDPTRPVEVRTQDWDLYKVGVSPIWRLGKKALGIYLPLRFRRGNPFHAGAGWGAMEVALKGMVKVLAR